MDKVYYIRISPVLLVANQPCTKILHYFFTLFLRLSEFFFFLHSLSLIKIYFLHINHMNLEYCRAEGAKHTKTYQESLGIKEKNI